MSRTLKDSRRGKEAKREEEQKRLEKFRPPRKGPRGGKHNFLKEEDA